MNVQKVSLSLVLPWLLAAMSAPAAAAPDIPAGERLGSVSFAVSCAPAVRARFDRGVALLHDFWYTEAEPQFERIAAQDPKCAMAHWGIAMSVFHEIWDRPDEAAMARGSKEMEAARAAGAKSAREREYIAALSGFFGADSRPYQTRIDDYAAAMHVLYQHHPGDVDAGAFYALALLAAEAPDDTSLSAETQAMTVLRPLFARYPDHPGVVHYIIHACDNPQLAQDGLAAARRYGRVAPSGPHAVHMPGHIFARLGLWQEDIDANQGSVAASQAAQTHHLSGAMDQFHSDDFLLYAYLQSGQDARAKELLGETSALLDHFEHMPNMSQHYMTGMFPHYRGEYPAFYDLEMRDWAAAAALQPIAQAPPESQTLTYWAQTIAFGHLHQPREASAALASYDHLIEQIKQGRHGYLADSTQAQIERGEMAAWSAFAAGLTAESIGLMRRAADLQDTVGQGEVDIPAREMLADILLENAQPDQALREYRRALALSPNRFNGLYGAGVAAENTGDAATARTYFAALLKSTDGGAHSSRPQLEHARTALAGTSALNAPGASATP